VEPSLGDDIAVPWYTTFLDFVDHWQALIAGLIALIAAIITVFCTLKVEQRKVDRELDALRKSLPIELRQLIPTALGVHGSLANPGSRTDGLITARWKVCRERQFRSSIRQTPQDCAPRRRRNGGGRRLRTA
jgi:hypothetical protein